MAGQKISKRVVDAAKPSGDRDTFIWDSEMRGFGLRISAQGVKSYVLQYRVNGRKIPRRTTIGKHGSPWSPDTARKEAERLLYLIRQGIDPVEEERRARRDEEMLAFDTYADRFVELYLKEHWKDTWKSGRSVLNNIKPLLAGKSILSIRRADIAEILDRYADRPGARKLTHSVLRKLFNWAADRGDLEVSPIANMKAPKAVAARKRVLTNEELVCVWLAAGEMGEIWRPLIRLLILTLQRRDEVASLDWSELDLGNAVWELPGERAKNGEAHRVPLNQLARVEIALLSPKSTGFVFTSTETTAVSGFSDAKEKLDSLALGHMQKRAAARGEDASAVKLAAWRFHDLRRTGATNLQALGVPIEVTEAVLNHISGTRGGIAGVYNRFRYDPQKQRALETWSAHLQQLVEAPGAVTNVIPLARYA